MTSEQARIKLEQAEEPDGAETSGGGRPKRSTSGQEGLRVSLMAWPDETGGLEALDIVDEIHNDQVDEDADVRFVFLTQ